MKLLTEIEAPEAIKKLLADAETAKFAVAFWGKALRFRKIGHFRKREAAQKYLQSPVSACNPTEIRELLKLAPSVEVRTNPRLHAKVYWTPTGVVVGSSNASAKRDWLLKATNSLAGLRQMFIRVTMLCSVKAASGSTSNSISLSQFLMQIFSKQKRSGIAAIQPSPCLLEKRKPNPTSA